MEEKRGKVKAGHSNLSGAARACYVCSSSVCSVCASSELGIRGAVWSVLLTGTPALSSSRTTRSSPLRTARIRTTDPSGPHH